MYLRTNEIVFLIIKQDNGQEIVSRLLDRLMKSDKYGDRRGAAFGLAGVIKGFGIRCLKTYGIIKVLQEGLEDRYNRVYNVVMSQ